MDKREVQQLINSIKDLLDEYTNTTDDNIKKNEKSADKINKKKKDTADEINTETESSWEKIGDRLKQHISNATSSLMSNYEQMLRSYTETQQQLQFNLFGSNLDMTTVRNTLDSLSTNTFVRQQQVYSNLTNLVTSGITANATQRAFLQTLSDNTSLGFNNMETSLNRLIQLQRTDLSESRLVMMAGLREFLQQNYQNSQYIKQGFSQVSDALLEMQSIMSADVAISTERTIQTYLGSFSAAGGSAGGSIAQALNAIGTGNFSGLDQGMQNLMVMAASRAGLSYADLLTGGLDAASSDALLTAAFSYIADMQDVGGGNNVAMNAMARLFGVNVSDIRAASQMNLGAARTGYNYSLSDFLGAVQESTPESVQLSNLINNLISNQAMSGDLTTYEVGKMLYPILGDLSSAVGSLIPVAGNFLGGLGNAYFNNAQLLGVLGGMLGDIGGASGLWSALTDIDLGGILKGGGMGTLASGVVANVLSSIKNSIADNSLLDVYNSTEAGFGDYLSYVLSDEWRQGRRGSLNVRTGETSSFSAGSGNLTGWDFSAAAQGGQDTSGSGGGTTAVTNYAYSDEGTLGDIYNLLANDFPNTVWPTMARIADGGNAVILGDTQITFGLVTSVAITADYVQGIFELLDSKFATSMSSSMREVRDNTWKTYGHAFGVF